MSTKNGTCPNTITPAARWYLENGFDPLPAGYRTKHPIDPRTMKPLKDWNTFKPGPDDFAWMFPASTELNIAIRNGEPSDNRVDVDLDTPQARAIAELLLPSTGMIFGRKSSPRSHWIYKTDVPFPKASDKYCDLDGSDLLELRGTGGITIFPPSSHKDTGEVIAWEVCSSAAEVTLEELLQRVRMVAAAAILARHWPAKGSLHDARLTLAGGLLRAQWDQDLVVSFIEAVARAAGNTPGKDIRGVVRSTAEKLEQGDTNVRGWPSLAQLIGEGGNEVIGRVRTLLGIQSQPPSQDKKSKDEAWQTPVPLRTPPPVPPIPLQLFPEWIRNWAEALADSIQVPADLPAMLALTIAGAGLARKYRLHVRGDWFEPLNIYSTVAMLTGERKSTAFSKAMRPVQKLTGRLRKQVAEQTATLNFDKGLQEKQLKILEKAILDCKEEAEDKALRKQAAELVSSLEKTVPPVHPVLVADDETLESLAKLLVEQQGRVLVASPEGTPLEIIRGRYAGKINPDVYLKGYSGDRIDTGRIGRERQSIDNPALSMALAVQPHVLLGLAEDATLVQRGFLARIFYSFPPSRVGQRRINTARIPEVISETYEARMSALWETDYGGTDEDGEAKPHMLRLSREAVQAMQDFELWLEPQLAPEGDLSQLAGWGNKLAGGCARVAAVMHLCSGSGSIPAEIPQATMIAAIELCRDYLLPHARAVFSLMMEDQRIPMASKILKWIKDQWEHPGFTKRDCHRRFEKMKSITRVEDLDKPLELLEKHGWIRQLDDPETKPVRGRPASPVYEIHPDIKGKAYIDNIDNIDTKPDQTTAPPNSVVNVDIVDISRPLKNQPSENPTDPNSVNIVDKGEEFSGEVP